MKPKYKLLKLLIVGAISLSCGTRLMANTPQENIKDSKFLQDDIATQNIDSKKTKPSFVTIKGARINLDMVSTDRFTGISVVKSDSLQSQSNSSIVDSLFYEINKIYVSENKRFILLVTTGTFIDSEIFDSKLEFYNNEGEIIWKASMDNDIYDCKISEDGKYLHAYWENPFSSEIYLVTYDSIGREIIKIKDVNHMFSNSFGDIIYYGYRNKKSNVFGCLNYRNDSFWEKSFPVLVLVRAVASVTGDVIVSSGQTLWSFSSIGNLYWAKSFEHSGGFMDLSSNGKSIVLIAGMCQVRIFDNDSCKIIFSADSLIFNNEKLEYVFGFFIENTELIYLCDYSPSAVKFIIMDKMGKIITVINVNKMFKNNFKIKCYKKNELDIYFDGVFVQSNKFQ